MKKIFIGIFLGMFIIVFVAVQKKQNLFLPHKTSTNTPFYEGSAPLNPQVSIFDESLGQITQIEITPNSNYMLVGTLPGTVWIYKKIDGVFLRQKEPFFIVKTSHPGFPPREAGLTGIILGADFGKSGDVFLTYSYAEAKKTFKNRVSRVTFKDSGGNIFGQNHKLIFEANVKAAPAHQIQDGVGVFIQGKPHVLFSIGEGFQAKRALDPKLEAGKIMLLSRDGSVAAGTRPFSQNLKVQAIGVRNPPPMTQNPKNGKVLFADTGPNNFDRLIYAKLYDQKGGNDKQQSFNWDGTEASLQKPAPDLYDSQKQNTILYHWVPTETVVSLAFYENSVLPQLKGNQQYVLATTFGKTGEKTRKPGKEILLGTITHGRQDAIIFQKLVERAGKGEGKLGHPIGLGVDSATGDIYFGDIMEGRIYKVKL